ncbi:MAG: glycosyltransferase [Acidobacteria bacterium]|nr:glycosyltransferase [Acidobacteriota bacterium]
MGLVQTELSRFLTPQYLLWVSVAVVFYTYIGYHAIILLMAKLASSERDRKTASPPQEILSVSVIVAAYNEEAVIRQRIENLLELDYPSGRLEIVIASDGSTDSTVEIAAGYTSQGVLVMDLSRRGRALIHNEAVLRARGEVIVFTDADALFERSFIRAVVRRFQEDPSVGCVVGNLRWRTSGTAASWFRSFTWMFEISLKESESRLGLLASASGPAMAVRRNLWKPMSDPVDDCDSITPLDVILQGCRVIFASDAVAYDSPFATAASDFRSKVRGVSKSVVMIPRRWGFWNLFRHSLISWALLSHFFLRWISPYFMITAFVLPFTLREQGGIYGAIFLVEIAILVLVGVGFIGECKKRRFSLASPLYNFVVINAGFAIGVLKGAFGLARGPYETE